MDTFAEKNKNLWKTLPNERKVDIFALLPERAGLLRCVCSNWRDLIQEFIKDRSTALSIVYESNSLFLYYQKIHTLTTLTTCQKFLHGEQQFMSRLTTFSLVKQQRPDLFALFVLQLPDVCGWLEHNFIYDFFNALLFFVKFDTPAFEPWRSTFEFLKQTYTTAWFSSAMTQEMKHILRSNKQKFAEIIDPVTIQRNVSIFVSIINDHKYFEKFFKKGAVHLLIFIEQLEAFGLSTNSLLGGTRHPFVVLERELKRCEAEPDPQKVEKRLSKIHSFYKDWIETHYSNNSIYAENFYSRVTTLLFEHSIKTCSPQVASIVIDLFHFIETTDLEDDFLFHFKYLSQFHEITPERLQFLTTAYGSVPEFCDQIEQYKFYSFCFSDQQEEPVSKYYDFVAKKRKKFSEFYNEVRYYFHSGSNFRGSFVQRSNNLIILLQRLYNYQREEIRNNIEDYHYLVQKFFFRFEELFLAFKCDKAIEYKLFRFVFLEFLPKEMCHHCEEYFFNFFTPSEQKTIIEKDPLFVQSISGIDSSFFDQYIALDQPIYANTFKSLSLDNLKKLNEIDQKKKDLKCRNIFWQISMCQDLASLVYVCSINYTGITKLGVQTIVKSVIEKLIEFEQLNSETLKLCLPGLCYKLNKGVHKKHLPHHELKAKYYINDHFIQHFVDSFAVSPYGSQSESEEHWFIKFLPQVNDKKRSLCAPIKQTPPNKCKRL